MECNCQREVFKDEGDYVLDNERNLIVLCSECALEVLEPFDKRLLESLPKALPVKAGLPCKTDYNSLAEMCAELLSRSNSFTSVQEIAHEIVLYFGVPGVNSGIICDRIIGVDACQSQNVGKEEKKVSVAEWMKEQSAIGKVNKAKEKAIRKQWSNEQFLDNLSTRLRGLAATAEEDHILPCVFSRMADEIDEWAAK